MCHCRTKRKDLTPSRFRWVDTPALLLMHRAWRCRKCGERVFLLTGAPANIRLLDQLWKHYSILTAATLVVLVVLMNEFVWR